MSTTALTASRVPNNLRFRRTFGRIKKIIDIPNLIEIQKRSYEEFLQRDVAPETRKEQGLQAVFKSVFPIKDFNETASLEFVSYTLSEPKYDVEECHQRGMTSEDLLNYYYRKDTIIIDGRKAAKRFQPDHLVGVKATRDLRHPQSNELIVKEGRKFTKAALRQMEQAGIEQIPIALEEVLGRVAAHDVKDPKTNEILLATNEEITDEKLELFRQRGISKVEVLFLDDTHIGPSLRNTLLQDKIEKPEDAILKIYRRLRPGDPPTPETATASFHNLFFNPERYDLSRVAPPKLNHKLKLNVPPDQ